MTAARVPDLIDRHGVFGRNRIKYPIEVDLSTGPASDEPAPGAPAQDIPAAIAELNAQHAAGLISYEEMAEGVKRVLGA